MIRENADYKLGSCLERKYVEAAIFSVKSGDTKPFLMYADELIREYATREDYEYWVEKKQLLKSAK